MVYLTKKLLVNIAETAQKVVRKATRLPPLPSPRELLKLYRIHASKHLSQNFLLDIRLTNKIVTTTGNVRDCYVCEVGPGPGNITRHILENGAKKVTVIEKDKRFLPALQLLTDVSGDRLKVVWGDIMDINCEDIFPKELAHDWTMPSPPFYIIGNLPFNVSTPLIIRWLRHCSQRSGPFAHGRTRLTLTFQKEVADRMIAPPGSDVRCRLSVMCQHLCHVEQLFTIPGRAFFPKPEVDVTVVKFTPLIKPQIVQPFSLVEKVARIFFHHRQKTGLYGIKLLFPPDRPDLTERVLAETKFDPKKRSFEYYNEEFRDLCNIFSTLCSENDGLIDYDYRHAKDVIVTPHVDVEEQSKEIQEQFN